MERELRVIISGGGTGGHIFPAISIANSIKELKPDAKILFVGAEGRMEMEKVPAAGYNIKGIPARGLKRPLYSPSNIGVVIDYFKCKSLANKIIKDFKPNLVIGVGGYASAAIVSTAAKLKIPILLQEQNSFAGLVNKKNGKNANKICVAYEGMERFFPKEKIILTGNPIRKDINQATAEQKAEGYKFYNLNPDKKQFL
jgi:UDP-N-acetylglucosamine:LPS N-acetylglucosamine transferase